MDRHRQCPTLPLRRTALSSGAGATRSLPTGALSPAGRGGRKNNNNGVAARCGCDRRIRVAESVLEAGPITCGLCGTDFEAADAGG